MSKSDGRLSEDEASKKWCPFVRLTNGGSERVFNRWVHEPIADIPDVCCAGSSCMAWRWYSSDRGYCGLAGKP